MRYFDLIFTLHSQDQLKNRGIKIAEAWETFKHPIRTQKGRYGGLEFEHEFDDYKITVVAIQNNKNEWIVKSVWRNPPLLITADARQKQAWKKYSKAGFWAKTWIIIKQQLGI
ncbi:MAG: hypothetical protein A2868_00525 [Candidatus Levybacteria bacterium RIFCSPHIGHO2_01_FULL_40_15b]|nr:MAG: hypothetical protein A2868_00525 [Candidatus Levybacteria bacterium RIFCSPHIGHO2_01_FULL_40_15b]